VLNRCDIALKSPSWDVHASTSIILDDLASTVDQNPTFKKYADFWRARGKQIDTLEQLVASYYASFQVRDEAGMAYPLIST
jgi:hypothetical protein